MKYEPKIRASDEGGELYVYDDGHVSAVISSDLKATCEILEISSHQPGKGNGRKAVEWMKNEFGKISVNDPGNEVDSPKAFGLWKRLADHGIVNQMIDENGIFIFADGKWEMDEIDDERFPDLSVELKSKPGL